MGVEIFPTVYLSRPAVVLPPQRIENDELLARVREHYRGPAKDLRVIESIVKRTFAQCGSQCRYLEPDPTVRVADYAARASQACLDAGGVAATDVDLLINGSIAREYFEPSTAMEIAARLGIERIHAFDVTSACAGQLEAVHVACAYLNLYPQMQTALICAAELTRQFLTYDIQSVEELVAKVAGLTIGNAAAAWLVRRKPFPGGCLRLLAMANYSLPQNWHLCHAPIDGTFTSISGELFKLNVHVAPELQRMLDRLGWTHEDVDHFVFHQPSEKMIKKVLQDLGADPRKAVYTHHLFGNTSSTTVALAMNQLLQEREVRHGQKLILSTAASGFTMVTAAGEWVDER
jgi:3-oxoacyl-[acyl-carrier-protein] synthase-3